MAVTVDELLIKIELSGQKTSQELSKISDELDNIKKSSDKTSKGVGSLSANFAKFGVAAFAAIQGAQGLVSTLSSFAEEFIQAEDAVKKLNIALQLSGSKQIPELINKYQTLGDELESFGVTSTETVLKLAKIGVAAGQTSEQTEQLIKVAADLSVAREIPLETAFKSLSTTLKGSAGQLSAIFPELQNFSQEQLKAGDAVKYLSLQLGGFAQTNLETYSGQLALASTRLGDVKEELGRVIVGSTGATSSLSKMTMVLESLVDALRTNSSFLQDIVSGFLKVAEVLTSYVSAAFIGLFSIVVKGASGFVSAFGHMQRAISLVIPGTTQLGQSIIQMGKDLDKVGNELQDFTLDIVKSGTMFPDAMQKSAGSLDELTKKTQEAQDAFKSLTDTMMSPEQRQAVESLKNKVIELEKAQKTAGKTGIDLINAQATASRLEINEIAKKISGTGKLSAEYQKLVGKAQRFIELQRKAQVTQLNEEAITKVTDQYKVLGNEIAKQNMTQREFIDYQLQKELELLEAKRNTAAFETGEAQDLLDLTEKRLKAKAEKEKDSIPLTGKTFEAFTEAGQSVAKRLSEVFSAGSLEFIGAAASAVSLIVQAANAVLDLIPNLLNSIAGIFDKISDFPNILLNAFSNIFGAITRFVSEFIPNLLNFIPEFLKNLDQFVIGLVDAFVQLFKQIPAIIFGIIKDLPALIENIVSGMISAVPEIIIAVIDYLIEFGPQIFIKILKAIAIDIPIAILKGIMKGIARIGEAIKAALTGKSLKLPKVEVDKKQIENLQKRLTEQSSRIFNVSDFMEKAQDPMQAINDGIVEAAEKARDILKEAWQWVMDNIIQPIFDGLKAVWMFIYDKILYPIYNIVRSAWLWVYNNIIAPIAGVISSAWQWVVDNVIAPMQTLGEKIAAPFRDAIEAAGRFFGQIGEAFKSLFKLDFNGVKEAVGDAFNSAGEVLKNIFRGVMNPIVDIFNGLISAINGLKIPSIGWSISAGSFGSWSGTLIPEIDLIPGEINKLPRFAQGGFVENLGASFPGMGTDTVPAMLTPGEFVMNRRAVEANGLGLLNAMNRGQAPGGGDVYNINFEIQVDAKTTMDEGYIRGTLIPRMSEELRRASLDGKFVLSSRGIR